MVVERALREPDHLRANPYATLIQRLDRHLIALTGVAEDIRPWHAALVEQQFTGAAGSDPELVFLLADPQPRAITLDEKRRNAPVTGLGVDGRHDDKQAGFAAVRDPELLPAHNVVVTVFDGAGHECKGVAARPGF